MPQLHLLRVFCGEDGSGGNPLGVFLHGAEVPPERRQAVAADLGPDFPSGIFICQDGDNTAPGSAGRQNFKYIRLDQILDASTLSK